MQRLAAAGSVIPGRGAEAAAAGEHDEVAEAVAGLTKVTRPMDTVSMGTATWLASCRRR